MSSEEAPKAEKPVADTQKNAGKTMLAAVRIRGKIGMKEEVRRTLDMLRLHRQNFCSVYDDSVSVKGMLRKVKDFITFGTIDEATFKELVDKRGELYAGREQDSKGIYTYRKFIEMGGKKYKRFFRLSPPRGGFERKGIKKPFTTGGVLGDRKDKIANLIEKMW
ncbi:MAG: uL30 family ribosomal protein [archaeon]